MRCPVCDKPRQIEVLPLTSEEADDLCLLCEAEGVCRPCSRYKHFRTQEEEE